LRAGIAAFRRDDASSQGGADATETGRRSLRGCFHTQAARASAAVVVQAQQRVENVMDLFHGKILSDRASGHFGRCSVLLPDNGRLRRAVPVML
jgi:hypothetical protein